MNATQRERYGRLLNRMLNKGFTFQEVEQLLKISRRLSRWSEAECNGEIERDEETGKVSRVVTFERPEYRQVRYKIRDMEMPARRKAEEICSRHGLVAYFQGDPRGCALYITDGKDQEYTQGIAVTID